MTYWPSEFSQVRGQFRRTPYGDGPTAVHFPPNELLFQFNFRSARTARIRSSTRGSIMKIDTQVHAPLRAPQILAVLRHFVPGGRLGSSAEQAERHHDDRGPGAIAREVGGDRITVESIAKGYQDPHFVEAKPSFILKLQKADLLIAVGRELEIGWLPPLIQQSRNAKDPAGRGGLSRCVAQAQILEIPHGQITRAMGDVHPLGNPHYWLDPENGKRIAKEIADKLSEFGRTTRLFRSSARRFHQAPG